MTRREFLASAAVLQAVSSKPNILFILADDLGCFDLGCYGQKEIRTPNIDRLASEGTRFRQAYAGHAVCAPSRCCLMTGMHTGHATIRNNHSQRTGERVPLNASDVTVAEVLKGAGYATAIFGKWGLGEPGTDGVPSRQGFDEWFGFLNQDHAVDYYTEHLWRNEAKEVLKGNLNGAKGEYVQDLFTREAVRFIRANQKRPFFLYLAYTTPHADLMVPSDAPYADKPWSQDDRNYAAMVTRMDSDVGRIVALLDELNLAGNTLVIFSSDNGAGHAKGIPLFRSTGHLRERKSFLYEGGIRVPFIARWKGKVPAGRVSDEPLAFWDFLPTAAELAGAKAPPGIDGVPVVSALLGKPQGRREYFYWETNGKQGFTQAVRMGDWKAVHFAAQGALELYNLREDERETKDVAAAHPQVVDKARKILMRARTENPEYPTARTPKKIASGD